MGEVLLDTDTVSYLIRGQPIVVQRYMAYMQQYAQIYLSTITVFEINKGLIVRDSKNQKQAFGRFVKTNLLLPFDEPAAQVAANVYADCNSPVR